jgi:DNA-binding IclR family transcriptional regulator
VTAPEAWHVTRAMHTMELLAIAPRSAPELADGLGVHPRTARRILRRLEHDGYVELRPGGRRRQYRPTMMLVAVAGHVIDSAELPQLARPHVQALRDELKEDCHLCVPSYLSALCLIHASGANPDCCRPQLRELVPCHATAAGKALLAWRHPWRDAVLAQQLETFTERTMTGPNWLRRELSRTVARGYAIENGEYRPGTRALAAPVFSNNGQAVAALGVTAANDRMPPERLKAFAGPLLRVAAMLSTDLGHPPRTTGQDDTTR